MHVVLAGGGTAGHIWPALALADALRRADPGIGITALGTARGLEVSMVPEHGYDLRLIPAVPLPRRPTLDLLKLPGRVRAAVAATVAVLDDVKADVVVGFGGYVSLPAYLAARRRRTPIVVHEANARPGLANRIGARFTRFVATSTPNTRLPHARFVGIPLRAPILELDRAGMRRPARAEFGLDPTAPALLVSGGSQGARRLNEAAAAASPALGTAGIQVLHVHGPTNTVTLPQRPDGSPPYVAVPFVDRMELAYAAADFMLCRAGAMTCAELAAVGLPAAYVPLPIGNGEQRLNAEPIVRAGGGLLVADAELDAAWIERELVPVLTDQGLLAAMGAAAASCGHRDADEVLVRMVRKAAARGTAARGAATGGAATGEAAPSEAAPGGGGHRRRGPRARLGSGRVIVPTEGEIRPAESLGRVHFIGIGGAGMSGIARIMRSRGIPVSGSDAKDSPVLAELAALGAEVYPSHDAAHLGAADTVVVSSAIRESNPEYLAARERGLLILPRAAALAAIMVGRRTVAVAGTHGKTTTTAMLTVALRAAGADPSFALGGALVDGGEGAYDGTGELFVAEADESDGSFLLYAPHAAIVTNVEPDHLDHYGTPEAVTKAFVDFADRVSSDGFLVTCVDDPGAAVLAEAARSRGIRVYGYGESAGADVRISSVTPDRTGWAFTLTLPGRAPLPAWVPEPKRHDVANAAAALTVGLCLGLPADRLVAGLAAFGGTRRRFELRGDAGGVRVYDDYAHHPTEVAATLRAARRVAGGGRVVAVFQPHLFSRTKFFAAEFGAALGLADEVVVLDVYAAREDPLPGVSGALVAGAVPLPAGRVRFTPDPSAVPATVAALARPGDLVITLGAGDVTELGPLVLALLEAR